MKMKLIMESWNKFLKEETKTAEAPFYTDAAKIRRAAGEDEEPEEEEAEENIPGDPWSNPTRIGGHRLGGDLGMDLDTIPVDDYDADTLDPDSPIRAIGAATEKWFSKDARDDNLDPVVATSDASEFFGGSHNDPRRRDQSLNLPDTSKEIAWRQSSGVGPELIASEYQDLANENEDKQERNLRKAGFKNMERLQAMVGAQRTGAYDAQTVAKIMAFQKGLGLKGKDVDGIYGPGTRRAFKRSKGQDTLNRLKSSTVGKSVDSFAVQGAHRAVKTNLGRD